MKLKKETKYFLDHKDELEAKYMNRTIVIVGEKVIGDYDDVRKAFNSASLTYNPGKFLIKPLNENPTIFLNC